MSPTTQDDGEKLQDLVEQLSEAAKGYDASPGAAGYISRTSVSQVAKEIVRLMMAPSDMSMHHAANVSVKIVYFHKTGTELHASSSRSQPPPLDARDRGGTHHAVTGRVRKDPPNRFDITGRSLGRHQCPGLVSGKTTSNARRHGLPRPDARLRVRAHQILQSLHSGTGTWQLFPIHVSLFFH